MLLFKNREYKGDDSPFLLRMVDTPQAAYYETFQPYKKYKKNHKLFKKIHKTTKIYSIIVLLGSIVRK